MKDIREISNQVRIKILEASTNNRLHIGGMFSITEIMVDLFFNRIDFDNDTFILSKGHTAFLEYLLLDLTIGIDGDVVKFGSELSKLGVHPETNINFIETPTGSLGNGLGVGVGRAIYQKNIGKKGRTFVILGDGEMNEGAIWEAMQQAPKFSLDNLWVFVDNNGFQMTRESDSKMIGNLSEISRLLGWDSMTIDGHDCNEIDRVYHQLEQSNKCKLIIANTTKGKGIKHFENNPAYHHNSVAKEDLKKFCEEINGKK